MSMSRCSASVLTVYGRVGLVDDGSTLGSAAMRMMSGACPPPAPSVWKVWIVRPAIAAIVSSTNPASLMVSVWMASWTSSSSATRRLASMTAGVVPQSSWSLSPQAPAPDLLPERLGPAGVALAKDAPVDRQRLRRAQHPADVPGTGCHGRRVGAVARTGAATQERGDAAGQRRPHLLRRDHVDVGIDATSGRDAALARDDIRARADDQVGMDAVHDVRVAGLADGRDPPATHADIRLDDAQERIHDHHVGDDQVQRPLRVGDAGRLCHAVADGLAAPEDGLIPIAGQVALDLAHQLRVREPETVTRRGPVERGVPGAVDPHASVSKPCSVSACANASRAPGASSAPRTNPWPPVQTRPPVKGTSDTWRVSPGSNRTAVPAGMSSRCP